MRRLREDARARARWVGSDRQERDEIQRAVREAMREAQREMRRASEEMRRALREAFRDDVI